MKKKLIGLATGFLVFGVVAVAGANIINLKAYDATTSNPVKVSLSLTAGTYNVEVIGVREGGMYNAWNAWNAILECDDNGAHCSAGWITRYSYSSNEFGVKYYTDGISYITDLLALDKADDSSFTLSKSAIVDFYIYDSFYPDNLGGISLRVTEDSAPPVSSVTLPFLFLLLNDNP